MFPAGFPEERGEGEGEMLCGVEAVCFSPVLPVALTGSLSGVLGVWDLASQRLRHKCIHKVSVVNVRGFRFAIAVAVVRICPIPRALSLGRYHPQVN